MTGIEDLPKYAWLVDSAVDRQVLRPILEPYRPFRVEVNFSNGFSTREFGDVVAYANPAPLAKLHAFEQLLTINAQSRILDIGCHLGYYGHHFLKRGAGIYVGVEFDERLFDCAKLIRTFSGVQRDRLVFHHGDFGDREVQSVARRQGPYDTILSLASLNNICSLTAALLALPELLARDGIAVIEYLAIESEERLCQFHPQGFRGDSTLYWSFSEAFLDGFLGSIGMIKVQRPLEWQNEAVLGTGFKKILALYQHGPTP